MHDDPPDTPVFYSGDSPCSHRAARADLGPCVLARKSVHAVQVRFADQADEIETMEGLVHAAAGDAIVTGVFGEPWPVARASFAGKYEAVPPLAMGDPGVYRSLPIEVVGVRIHEAFEVVLVDGRSRLRGDAGDWLVDYGDGALGIVNAAVFEATYEILGVS